MIASGFARALTDILITPKIKTALNWYCDCVDNSEDCSSLAVLRFFLLNPDLAQEFFSWYEGTNSSK